MTTVSFACQLSVTMTEYLRQSVQGRKDLFPQQELLFSEFFWQGILGLLVGSVCGHMTPSLSTPSRAGPKKSMVERNSSPHSGQEQGKRRPEIQISSSQSCPQRPTPPARPPSNASHHRPVVRASGCRGVSCLLLCGFQESNSDCQAWQQVPGLTEPAHHPTPAFSVMLGVSGTRLSALSYVLSPGLSYSISKHPQIALLWALWPQLGWTQTQLCVHGFYAVVGQTASVCHSLKNIFS